MQFVMPDGHVRYQGPVIAREALRELPAEAAAVYDAHEQRDFLRREIVQTAGDHLSLLGTTSDGAQLLLVHMARAFAALSRAQTVEEVRAAAAPFADLVAPFLADVDADTVRLPFEAKGEAGVLTEIGTRATAVADALGAG